MPRLLHPWHDDINRGIAAAVDAKEVNLHK